MSDYSIEPLTCSIEDLDWSLKLPRVHDSESESLKVSLMTEQEFESLFTVTTDSFLILSSQSHTEFIKGMLCPEGDTIKIEF